MDAKIMMMMCVMVVIGVAGSTVMAFLDDSERKISQWCGSFSYNANQCPKGWKCVGNETTFDTWCVRAYPYVPSEGKDCPACTEYCPVGYELYDDGCEKCQCDTGKMG